MCSSSARAVWAHDSAAGSTNTQSAYASSSRGRSLNGSSAAQLMKAQGAGRYLRQTLGRQWSFNTAGWHAVVQIAAAVSGHVVELVMSTQPQERRDKGKIASRQSRYISCDVAFTLVFIFAGQYLNHSWERYGYHVGPRKNRKLTKWGSALFASPFSLLYTVNSKCVEWIYFPQTHSKSATKSEICHTKWLPTYHFYSAHSTLSHKRWNFPSAFYHTDH